MYFIILIASKQSLCGGNILELSEDELFSDEREHANTIILPFSYNKQNGTVDGRNPAPIDIVNIPLFTKFFTSQVLQDFFHQQ